MRYRKLGSSDIKVSEISLGCWTLGGILHAGNMAVGWADVDEAEAIRAMHLAIEKGVNHFDNADVYGNGKAERMLAKALGSKSKDIVIATKVGHNAGTAQHAYEALHIRHQCEQSLKNLNRDYIDLYYFHHGFFGPNDQYLDEAVNTMNALKEEGKIRSIGLSAYSNEDFLRLVPKIKPDVLQSWANAMDDCFIRDGSPVRALLEERKMSFVAFSPLGQGLLLDRYHAQNPPQFKAGDHRKSMKAFSVESLKALEPKLKKLKDKFGGTRQDLVRVALQYLLKYDVVACAIPGFRNSEQVEMNLSASGEQLSEAEFQFISSLFSDRSVFAHI